MKKYALEFLLISIIVLCIQNKVYAQETIQIKRISSPIQFDGIPETTEWEGIDLFPLTMSRPIYNIEPSEKSDVMIAYDDEYLWVGARLYMKDASKIFEASKKRDEQLFGYDAFGILLDTYDDNENGLAFYTTPTGLRTDYTVFNDGQTSGPPFSVMNFSWNTFWDVKTTRDDKGWYVEMRIPFSSLKFKPANDIATMGLLIVRSISANRETDTWPAVDPKYGFTSSNKPSLAQNIAIEGAKSKNPIYVSPYIIGGFSRSNVLNESETEYITEDNWEKNIGGDIKYNINSNLTLDLTVNTDFAQVEADNQQVNLTRYSLYFPEQRMFFQERSSLFSFDLGGRSDNLFYSRRIGLSDLGESIRIYGGMRIAGRIGEWDMGFLNMQTEEHAFTPSENFGVFRLRRRVINDNSYAGGIVTSRLGADGSQNFAYGLDGVVKIFEDNYATLKWSQTYDKDQADTVDWNFTDPSFFLVNLERRSEKGFVYNMSYTRSGETFNPGIGFVMRPALWGINARLLYGWLPGQESKLFNYSVIFNLERYERLIDNKLESFEMGTGFEINTKGQYGYELMLNYSKENVLWGYDIRGTGISISPGEYEQINFRGNIRTPSSNLVAARIELEGGDFFRGSRYSIGLEPTINLSSSIQISGGYVFDALFFPEKDANIHTVNGRVLYMLNTKLSASVLAQYVNTADLFVGNFRLRYNPREGNDFYLVYNDNRGFKKSDVMPEEPSFFSKTIMVKYTHTFIL